MPHNARLLGQLPQPLFAQFKTLSIRHARTVRQLVARQSALLTSKALPSLQLASLYSACWATAARTRRDLAEKRATSERKRAEALQQAARLARAELQQIQLARQQAETEQAATAAEEAKQKQAEQAFQQQRASGWAPKVGQTVYVPRLQGYAEVAAVGPGGKLTLKKGLLKISALVDEVRRQK